MNYNFACFICGLLLSIAIHAMNDHIQPFYNETYSYLKKLPLEVRQELSQYILGNLVYELPVQKNVRMIDKIKHEVVSTDIYRGNHLGSVIIRADEKYAFYCKKPKAFILDLQANSTREIPFAFSSYPKLEAAFCPQGNLLAVAESSCTDSLMVYDLSDLSLAKKIPFQTKVVAQFYMHPSKNVLVVRGTEELAASVYDLDKEDCIAKLPNEFSNSVHFTPNGNLLVSNNAREVITYDMQIAEISNRFPVHQTQDGISLSMLDNLRLIVSYLFSDRYQIMNYHTGQIVFEGKHSSNFCHFRSYIAPLNLVLYGQRGAYNDVIRVARLHKKGELCNIGIVEFASHNWARECVQDMHFSSDYKALYSVYANYVFALGPQFELRKRELADMPLKEALRRLSKPKLAACITHIVDQHDQDEPLSMPLAGKTKKYFDKLDPAIQEVLRYYLKKREREENSDS